MVRVLDEVAGAIRSVLGHRGFYPALAAVGLEELFGRPLTPKEWDAIRHRLSRELRPLEFVQGHWFLPDDCTTVWELADYVSWCRPEWEPPQERTEAAWQNAQIFVCVRTTLVETLSVREKDVTRPARLKDLIGDG